MGLRTVEVTVRVPGMGAPRSRRLTVHDTVVVTKAAVPTGEAKPLVSTEVLVLRHRSPWLASEELAAL